VVLALAVSFGAGCAIGCLTIPGTTSSGIGAVEQAWNIIFQDYVDKSKLDPTKLSQAAIEGMLEELNDPYTAYLDPETYKLAMSSVEGQFEGIGASVGVRDEKIVITSPIEDSPAAKVGIKAGDVILEINGESTEGISLNEAVLKIRGPAGTSVKLLVLHEGETEPVTLEIVRARIDTVSVRFEMKGEFAYIQITDFSVRTPIELIPALQALPAAKGIILDLRGNPGGALDSVVSVASYFLKQGVVLSVVDNKGGQRTLEAEPSDLTTDLPMVVLVDEFSASGSEVLSGALQDHKRATIAGVKTFGKGSVNILRQLQDGSGIYITTARWLTPNGRLIEGQGIQPDIELTLEGEDAINWAIEFLKSGNKEETVEILPAVISWKFESRYL